jgi:hypothetical protein
MFPESSLDIIKGYWKKKKYRFTIKLKDNLNILDLDTITKEQELEIVKNLDTQNEREYNKFMKRFGEFCISVGDVDNTFHFYVF